MKNNYIEHTKIKVMTLLVIVLWSTWGVAKVEVTIADQIYTYDANPRLSDVLKPIALKNDWYWASAAIFKLESNDMTPIRIQAIQKLAQLGQQDKANRANYQNVIDQLKSWKLANRIGSEIDYEMARIRLNKNPAFENGKYFISLSTRPKYVHVNGAITKQVSLNFEENTCVEAYLEQISLLDIASKDFVYVIQPNGSLRSVGVAYWNKQCVLIMPGSQIYVPLVESPIFSDIATLNKSVTKLLSNRIVNQ